MLQIHRTARAGELVDGLVELLLVPPDDPFDRDVVAVESLGVQRWLSQSLASRLGAGPGGDGVCANVEFPSPGRLLADVVATASGIALDDDPWSAARLPWHVLHILDSCSGETWLAPVTTYLGRDGRRMATATRIARLFASYMRHRPELVEAWLTGADGVPSDLAWQPQLFRRLRADVAVPSPVERISIACATLTAGGEVALPSRISLFNPTDLTASELRVFEALGSHRDIHIWDAEPPSIAAVTAGVQVHSCHGRLRQVEVLREVLLGLLADDERLELRDVVVMCPDVAAFAPFVAAVFPDDGLLQVRLADRGIRETNAVVAVLARLVELVRSRLTLSEVLDFASLPGVRAKFELSEDDLEKIADWAERVGVRWGLDAAARAPYSLDRFSQNTWRAGLDRLLAGVAMDEEGLRLVGGVLPLDDVDSGDIDLVGRFAELVDRLGAALASLSPEQPGGRPIGEWVAAIERALDDLVAVSFADGWQVMQANRYLARVIDASAHPEVPLELADVRRLLDGLLGGTPVRAGFRSGKITVTSLAPLRGVPHRVVAVLGLDDGEFPRPARRDGDDLLARDPHPDDPDRSRDDRRLLWEAARSAEQQLLLFYSGHDERTGAVRAPAVPLAELVESLHLDVIEHPLQPFDPRAFVPGALVARRPFSFDAVAFAGARAITSPRNEVRPFLDGPIPLPAFDIVELDQVTRFLTHPVREFLKQGLEIVVPGDEEVGSSEIAVELSGLDEWKIGDRLLRAGIDNVDYSVVVAAEIARGDLPPGLLGKAAFDKVLRGVVTLLEGSAELRQGPAERVDLDIELPSGRRLVGNVRDVYGDHVVRLDYSRFRPRLRLTAWAQLLAVTTQHPDRQWVATIAGRGRGPGEVEHRTFKGVLPDQARFWLDELLDLMTLGLSEPLPLFEEPSATYAANRRSGRPPEVALARARFDWEKRYGGAGKDACHRLVWGEADFDEVIATSRGDDTEPHRFGALARRLWDPLLAGEVS